MVLDDGWIEQLYVHPSRTGQGLGSALVSDAKQRCPERLRLWTFQSMLALAASIRGMDSRSLPRPTATTKRANRLPIPVAAAITAWLVRPGSLYA
jgi:GNAT superfamily N-acetyltransferase